MSPILMAYLPKVHSYAILEFVSNYPFKKTIHSNYLTLRGYLIRLYFITLSILSLLKPTGNFTYHKV